MIAFVELIGDCIVVILPPVIASPAISLTDPLKPCSIVSLKASSEAPIIAPLAVPLEGSTMAHLEGHISSLRRVCQIHLPTKRIRLPECVEVLLGARQGPWSQRNPLEQLSNGASAGSNAAVSGSIGATLGVTGVALGLTE